MPDEKKKEYAYEIAELKNTFESKWYNVSKLADKIIDVIENAYKLSPKDTPYDDYDAKLKAISLWSKIIWVWKSQQVVNVLNMWWKPPQIN